MGEEEEEEETTKPFLNNNLIVIRYVNATMSNSILHKFPDHSAFGFDYSQSAIWSPLVLPRFKSATLPCLRAKSPDGDFKRRILFDEDGGGDGRGGCGGFAGIGKMVCGFGSRVNDELKTKTMIKMKKFDECNKSKVSDFTNSSPTSSKKGWKKALKMTSKQFKKKRDPHQIHHHPTNSRITLADYLQCQNF
ncbi:hypothetical protein vseg_015774 [Gypsophila vaccaria]